MTRGIDLTKFDTTEVHACKYEYAGGPPPGDTRNQYYVEQCDDAQADFFSLYGHYSAGSGEQGVESLLDFKTREEAERAGMYFKLLFMALLALQYHRDAVESDLPVAIRKGYDTKYREMRKTVLDHAERWL